VKEVKGVKEVKEIKDKRARVAGAARLQGADWARSLRKWENGFRTLVVIEV
jgi:hypothetical protein